MKRIAVILFLAILYMLPTSYAQALPPVSIDGISYFSACCAIQAVNSWSHTTNSGGSNGNLVMVVGVDVGEDFFSGMADVTSVTYGGQVLTKIRADKNTFANSSELWYLKGPLTGPNNVTVTLTGARRIRAVSYTFANVDQTIPFSNHAGTTSGGTYTSSASISVPGTSSTDMVVDMVATGTGSPGASICCPSAGQTRRYYSITDTPSFSDALVGASSTKAGGSSSTTMSWGIGGSSGANVWAISAVALKQSPTAPVIPTFSNVSGQLLQNSASFNFSYSGTSSNYIIDISSSSNMSGAQQLGQGPSSPITVSNPSSVSAMYSCGATVYWKVYNLDRSIGSSIQSNLVSCNTFSNLSSALVGNQARFSFTDSQGSSNYIVDVALDSGMVTGLKSAFAQGSSSPIILDNPAYVYQPSSGWGYYECGRILYWVINNANRTIKSTPQSATVTCPAGTFGSFSSILAQNSASFGFSYSGSTTDYIIDMSSSSDMSTDVFPNFARGYYSPLITGYDPSTAWSSYTCNRILYWKIFNSDRSVTSPIQSGVVCAAPVTACGGGVARVSGLVSTPDLSGNFATGSGACIVDRKAVFAPFKIPTFDDLASLYFTQAKEVTGVVKKFNDATNPASHNVLNYYLNDTTNNFPPNLALRVPNLDITGAIIGTRSAVVFVDGNLNISSNITYGTSTTGTTFVVKGNVNISQAVTRIDAVIIAEGTICTAADLTASPPTCPSTSQTAPHPQLIINGSLISLNESNPIQFRRSLDPASAVNNTNSPAEKINHQVKYLVILRNLFADTLQRWSEN